MLSALAKLIALVALVLTLAPGQALARWAACCGPAGGAGCCCDVEPGGDPVARRPSCCQRDAQGAAPTSPGVVVTAKAADAVPVAVISGSPMPQIGPIAVDTPACRLPRGPPAPAESLFLRNRVLLL